LPPQDLLVQLTIFSRLSYPALRQLLRRDTVAIDPKWRDAVIWLMYFPDTRHSAIDGVRAEDDSVRRRSLDVIINAYWQPIHAYLQLRWRETDDRAADMTQAFFSKILESPMIATYDPSKGLFRTYLRACLDNFVLNARKKERRGETVLLDFDVPASTESPDEIFHREWVRRLFSLAIEDLRASRDQTRFRVFERYDLSESSPRPTYAQLAQQYGVMPETITNYLAGMRREFRGAVLKRLRELTATDREFRSEARIILGIEV
jgi:RNA polymerase sigma factor (sigma-70 family)